MRLSDRLSRLRWMAIPIFAYLVITLGLPVANGAAARRDFGLHAGWVVAGCLVVVAIAALSTLSLDAFSRILRATRGARP